MVKKLPQAHHVDAQQIALLVVGMQRDFMPGAEFVAALQFPDSAIIVSKGVDPESHGYSAFEDTGLGHLLTDRGIRELWVAGLATEYSVCSSVLGALYAGFDVTLLVDAIA